MLKIVLSALMLPLLLLFGSPDGGSSNAPNAAKTSLARQGESGTLQKMIVASGSVSMARSNRCAPAADKINNEFRHSRLEPFARW